MADLKEELRARPGEDAVDYAERIEAALEQHHRKTGERISAWSILPGEGPAEALERDRKLSEADKIRAASRERQRSYPKSQETTRRKENDVSTEESSRSYRIKSQERDAERAIASFEEANKRLYRGDGSKVYGEAEHSGRLGKLTETWS
jgi:hypothetical protein